MNLQPQASFTVVRQIANHTDTATYYVQVVIRNAYTDAVVDTLKLIDRGGQRFSKNWQVPADPSGQGFYVSIVSSVYTDSGYTTKSENYGDEENTYLVQERVQPLMRGGGLDVRTLRRVVQDEVAKIEFPSFPEIPVIPQKEYTMRWNDVLTAIEELKITLKPIEPEKVNLKPVLKQLDMLEKTIKDKPITPETDLSVIESRLADVETSQEKVQKAIQEASNLLKDSSTTVVVKRITDIMEGISIQVAARAQLKTETDRAKPIPFDISKLAL